MEWQQMVYFHAVATSEHMTLAAERLKISQPALSRSISRLERELGVPLFDRPGRAITLNRYGRQLLRHVTAILDEYDIAKRELQDMIHPEKGQIHLGFLSTVGTVYIPEIIRKFHDLYPDINFQLSQNNTPFLLQQLLAGDIDLCISSTPEDMPGIAWTHLWSEELFIFVPSGHRLAGLRDIDLAQIAEEPLISFKKGNWIRKSTDDLFRMAGIVPHISFEGEGIRTILGLVAAGLGIALIPEVRGTEPLDVAKLHVRNMTCQRELGVAIVRDRYLSPSATRFHQFVVDASREA